MNKLMSSLLAATLVGAFSLSAVAATAPAGPDAAAIAEKPADAPMKHVAKKHIAKKHVAKKHVAKAKKPEAAAPMAN